MTDVMHVDGAGQNYHAPRDCQHGQLARSCDRCADAEEIAELRAALKAIYQRTIETHPTEWGRCIAQIEALARTAIDGTMFGA